MDLYETLTQDLYRSAVEHYEEIFGYQPTKNLGFLILPVFADFTTQQQL